MPLHPSHLHSTVQRKHCAATLSSAPCVQPHVTVAQPGVPADGNVFNSSFHSRVMLSEVPGPRRGQPDSLLGACVA